MANGRLVSDVEGAVPGENHILRVEFVRDNFILRRLRVWEYGVNIKMGLRSIISELRPKGICPCRHVQCSLAAVGGNLATGCHGMEFG